MEERSHFCATNVWSSLSESLTWQHSSVQQMCTHTPGMRAPGRPRKRHGSGAGFKFQVVLTRSSTRGLVTSVAPE